MRIRSLRALVPRCFLEKTKVRFRIPIRPRAALPTLFAVALASHAVLAEDRAELLAESSFAEGVKLMRADRCALAIVKFEESQRLDPASGTALNLAYCQARLGRIATAWLEYRQAITLAEAQGKAEHARIGRTEAEKLEPELPHLTLNVPKGKGATPAVELDAEPLPADMWSVPIPVDPGRHEVTVSVNHARVWQSTVTIARRERVTMNVPPEKMENSMAQPAGGTPATGAPVRGEAEPGRAPRVVEAPRPGDTQRTWALVIGGVGAAAVLTGAALFTSARLQYDGVGDHCTGNACDDEGYSARQSAASRARASYVVLAGGAALLGASVVLWVTHDHGSTTSMALEGTASSLSFSVRRVF